MGGRCGEVQGHAPMHGLGGSVEGVQRVIHYWDWQRHHQCIPSPTTHNTLLLLAWVHILGRHLPIHHVAPTASIIGAHPLLRATLLFHIKIYINIYIYRHAILLDVVEARRSE